MKTLVTNGIILRRIDYGEADRIMTLLTPENGKLSVIAKGARKSKSKLAGGLELFSESVVSLIDGKSELKTIISTQLLKYYGDIASNLERAMFGYECLKTIDLVTEADCESNFYDTLRVALEALADDTVELITIQLWFYMTMLRLLGMHINIDRQADGSSLEEMSTYTFDHDRMGFLAYETGKYLPKHIKLLRLISKVSSPKHLLHVQDVQILSLELVPLTKQLVLEAYR